MYILAFLAYLRELKSFSIEKKDEFGALLLKIGIYNLVLVLIKGNKT